MERFLPERGTFSCIALQTYSAVSQEGIQLSDSLFASGGLPIVVDDFWKTQIGIIGTEKIGECNLFLCDLAEGADTASDPSLSSVHSILYGLLVQGKGYTRRGFVLGGQISNYELRVSSLGDLNKYFPPHKVLPSDVDNESLVQAVNIARGIDDLYELASETGPYLRIRKGFNAFLEGMQEAKFIHERLHQFVRAVEAAIKPKQGDGTRKFKYRGQMFTGHSKDAETLLEELYEMRSAAEHLNPLKEKLTAYPENERQNLISLRTYQAELIASFVYRHVFTRTEVSKIYETDDSIADFWSLDTGTLIKFWGQPVDLSTPVKQNYHEFL